MDPGAAAPLASQGRCRWQTASGPVAHSEHWQPASCGGAAGCTFIGLIRVRVIMMLSRAMLAKAHLHFDSEPRFGLN